MIRFMGFVDYRGHSDVLSLYDGIDLSFWLVDDQLHQAFTVDALFYFL
jgi:hypothetical protein